MKIQSGGTYLYQGKAVRVLAELDSKSVLITNGKVLTVQKKDLADTKKKRGDKS